MLRKLKLRQKNGVLIKKTNVYLPTTIYIENHKNFIIGSTQLERRKTGKSRGR